MVNGVTITEKMDIGINEETKSKSKIHFSSEPRRSPALLFGHQSESKLYWDRSHYDSPEAQMRALSKSSTLYVGNLAFSTRSHHLLALFSTLGNVKKIFLGLDRFKKTPCGFAFVEYADRICALSAVSSLSGSKLDGKRIRVELDAGFKPGRQYGRGTSGGQVRDDRRQNFDPARRSGGGNRSRYEPPPPQQQQQQQQQPTDMNNSSIGQKRDRDDSTDDQLHGDGRSKNPRFDDEM